jgi:hypothetical protein
MVQPGIIHNLSIRKKSSSRTSQLAIANYIKSIVAQGNSLTPESIPSISKGKIANQKSNPLLSLKSKYTVSTTTITTMASSSEKETASTTLPPLSHVLETCLYVRDVKASSKFYREALNIEPFMESVS